MLLNKEELVGTSLLDFFFQCFKATQKVGG